MTMTQPPDGLLTRLAEIFPAERWSARENDLEPLRSDSSAAGEAPWAAVWPVQVGEVVELVEAIREYRTPLFARGAGSGKAGGAVPTAPGVVVDFSRMNRILEINGADMVVVAEPGVIVADLQQAVEAEGLFFPPDPASQDVASVGGIISTCAGGMRALKYGVTRDYVLGLKAIDGRGRFLVAGGRCHKDAAGFDLTRLLVGSEGCLALTVEATLKLIPLPPVNKTLVGAFDDLPRAAEAVGAVFRAGLLPTALEFLDATATLAASTKLPWTLPEEETALILTQADGSAEAVREQIDLLAEVFEQVGGRAIYPADEAEAEQIWAARRDISEAVKKIKPLKISEDIAVPRSRLVEAVDGIRELARPMGLTTAVYGHAGDGNCHVNIMFDNPDQKAEAEKLSARIFRLTVDLGGTITGEHGVGILKKPFLPLQMGPGEREASLGIKGVFDPDGLLNPGKIFI